MRQLAALENSRYLKTITYIFASVRVVEETIIRGRSMGQMHAELEFKTLTEHVGTGVPEAFATFFMAELEEYNLTIAFKRARCVIFHPAIANLTFLFLRVL